MANQTTEKREWRFETCHQLEDGQLIPYKYYNHQNKDEFDRFNDFDPEKEFLIPCVKQYLQPVVALVVKYWVLQTIHSVWDEENVECYIHKKLDIKVAQSPLKHRHLTQDELENHFSNFVPGETTNQYNENVNDFSNCWKRSYENKRKRDETFRSRFR